MFCLLTTFRSLPRTRDSERDLWLYWAWQQVTRWHASRSTIWAWRPFLLNFKSNAVSSKNVIYSKYLNSNTHCYANLNCHKFIAKFYKLKTKFLLLNFRPEHLIKNSKIRTLCGSRGTWKLLFFVWDTAFLCDPIHFSKDTLSFWWHFSV